jgi:WD40 repeat protein
LLLLLLLLLLLQVWDVSEGRQPWCSTLPLPSSELALESGVWALSSSASGQLLVTGTDEGTVAAWDLRTQQQIWATQVRACLLACLRYALCCLVSDCCWQSAAHKLCTQQIRI